jgi:hypothetical protein
VIEWQAIGVVAAIVSAIAGALAWAARTMLATARLVADIERRIEAAETSLREEVHRWRQIEAQINRIMADLPRDFVLRSDHVRDIAVVVARIDGLGEKIDRLIDRLIEVRRDDRS